MTARHRRISDTTLRRLQEAVEAVERLNVRLSTATDAVRLSEREEVVALGTRLYGQMDFARQRLRRLHLGGPH